MSPPEMRRPRHGSGADADSRPNQLSGRITRQTDSGVDAVARLSSYRTAAQLVRRQDAPFGIRCARMIALMQEARAEADSWTRELAEQIVYAQAQWLFEGDEALRRDRTRGRLEAAARRLRLNGYECCPECEQRLSDPADWVFWSALRRAEIDRLAALDREAGEAA